MSTNLATNEWVLIYSWSRFSRSSTSSRSSPTRRLRKSLACSVVGGSMTVERELHEFIEVTKPDELMIAALIYDHAARLRSYEITAEVRERLGSEERKVSVPAGV